jgi:hypothetical protein
VQRTQSETERLQLEVAILGEQLEVRQRQFDAAVAARRAEEIHLTPLEVSSCLKQISDTEMQIHSLAKSRREMVSRAGTTAHQRYQAQILTNQDQIELLRKKISALSNVHASSGLRSARCRSDDGGGASWNSNHPTASFSTTQRPEQQHPSRIDHLSLTPSRAL